MKNSCIVVLILTTYAVSICGMINETNFKKLFELNKDKLTAINMVYTFSNGTKDPQFIGVLRDDKITDVKKVMPNSATSKDELNLKSTEHVLFSIKRASDFLEDCFDTIVISADPHFALNTNLLDIKAFRTINTTEKMNGCFDKAVETEAVIKFLLYESEDSTANEPVIELFANKQLIVESTKVHVLNKAKARLDIHIKKEDQASILVSSCVGYPQQ